MRREAKVTLLKAYCISLPCDTTLWTRIVFTRLLFLLRVLFHLRWMTELNNVSASSYVWSSVKFSTKTLEMLGQAFGEHSLGWTVVFEWHSRLKTGRVSVEDDERSGWPSISKTTENVEKLRELIHKDRHRTIHELADTVGISYCVCQEILTEFLNMHRTAPSSRQCTHPHVPENHRVCD
jgi:hypothetical protein